MESPLKLLFIMLDMAGAVSVGVKYQKKTVFFTGDILFNDQRTLDGANLPREPVDILVTETTRVTETPKTIPRIRNR